MDDIFELMVEKDVLKAEKDKLKKRIRELEHVHQLDQSEIINYRRQIELLTEGNNGTVSN